MAKNIPLPDKDVSIYDYLEGEVGHTMFLNPVDDQEIIRTVQSCKNKMSTYYNDINMLMVNKIVTQIVRTFVHICNVSFQTGVFPDKMKIAKIVPLFKSGEKNVFTNSSSSSLGSRCVPWLGEGLSMPSPNYPVLCFPLPYRVAPVFVQVVSPSLGWSPLSSFLVIWSPTGDTRGPSVVFEAVY